MSHQDNTPQDNCFSELVDRILRDDRQALAEMFALYRPRLWRMVNFRLHPQLQGRIDADDVLQEAWLRAADRIGYFLREGFPLAVHLVSPDRQPDAGGPSPPTNLGALNGEST